MIIIVSKAESTIKKLKGAAGATDCNLGSAVAAVEANCLEPAVNLKLSPYFSWLKSLFCCSLKIIAPLQPVLNKPSFATPACPLPKSQIPAIPVVFKAVWLNVWLAKLVTLRVRSIVLLVML